MMKLFLSLCIMMSMLTGTTAPLPAVPETADTTVIRNVYLELDGEGVTLNPELAITQAVGSEAASLRFEVRNGDNVLLPMAGEITADGVRFTLMDSGRVYTLSEETLLDMMELEGSEEEVAMLEKMGDLYMRLANVYLEIFSGDYMDPAKQAEMNIRLMEALGAEAEDMEADVDGVMVPGKNWVADTDYAGVFGSLDVLAQQDDPVLGELGKLMTELFDVIGDLEGTQITSLEDMGTMMPEATVALDYSYAANDEVSYIWSAADMQMPDTNMDVFTECEQIVRGENMDFSMTYGMVDNNSGVVLDMTIDAQLVMDGKRITAADAACSVAFGGEAEDGIVNMDGSLTYSDEAGVKNGSANLNLQFTGPELEVMVEEGSELEVSEVEAEALSGDVALNLNWEEAPIETGAQGKVYLDVQADISGEAASAAFGFDYETGSAPAAEMITGDREVALTADLTGEGNNMLPIDFMGIVADGTSLAAEESVLELTNLLGSSVTPAMIYGADVYEYGEGEEVEEEEICTVTTQEEAAAIYGGTFPAYTAPEGFAVDHIDVSSWYYDAYYTDGENSINMYGYANADMGQEKERFLLNEDGSMTEIVQPMVDIFLYDGVVGNAEVTMGNEVVYFYFDYNPDMESAQAAIAGLIN